MDLKDIIVNNLNTKEIEMNSALNKLIDEKSSLRSHGHYRVINSVNYRINVLSARLHSLNFINELIYNVPFEDNISNVLNYLSPYGTFYDRSIFYYNKDKIKKYSDQHKIQIILCEIFNALQDYYIGEIMSETLKLSCRGRSLSCLYHIGIIDEYIPLYNGNESQIINRFNEKYLLHKVITFEPNDNAAKFLFNELIFNNKDELGLILERWELHDSLTIKLKSKKLHITESDGIEIVEAPHYEIKNFYFIKNEDQYIRSDLRNSTIREGKRTINITKKLTGE